MTLNHHSMAYSLTNICTKIIGIIQSLIGWVVYGTF